MSSVWPTGQTRVAGLIGYPARYSLSPTLHNAAYRDLALDLVYVVFPVSHSQIRAAVDAVRSLDMVGVSVTIPHKEVVVGLVDELTPEAQALAAVNTIICKEGKLIGDNTDGSGFSRSLKEDQSFDPIGKRCAVLGAGGAAKAVIKALADGGASEVAVVNRSHERAESACQLAGRVGRVVTEDQLDSVDLLVNATPLGMEGPNAGRMPVSPETISPGQLVVDLIYHPSTTPLLACAEDRGATTANGLGMLVHQAAVQIVLWTGRAPSIQAMRTALEPPDGRDR